MAIVYLLHFERPIGNLANPRGQAQHYIGLAKSLKKRLDQHRSGQGARLMAVVSELSVSWELARTWPNGTRALERQLKNRHNAPQLCPICKAEREKVSNP